jgi:hypothetical protein
VTFTQILGQDASYLADALVWETRVGTSAMVASSLKGLEPVLAQSLLSSLGRGISGDSAYQVFSFLFVLF